jgi:hypothetical protein
MDGLMLVNMPKKREYPREAILQACLIAYHFHRHPAEGPDGKFKAVRRFWELYKLDVLPERLGHWKNFKDLLNPTDDIVDWRN